MEAGVSTHDRRVILEPAAALGLHLFQLIQRGKHPIGQWLIAERPKPRSLLDLGRIRRGVQKLDSPCVRGSGTLLLPRATPRQPKLMFVSPSRPLSEKPQDLFG